MHSLRDLLNESQETGVAIGHFNISDLNFHKATEQLFLTQPAVTMQTKALERPWRAAVRSRRRESFSDSTRRRFAGLRE
jgi:hypothetical protein